MTSFGPPFHAASLAPSLSPTDWALQALLLALALGAPLATAAWLRVRAIRALRDQADAAWFGYARMAQWVTLGGWLAWILALSPGALTREWMPALSRLGLPWVIAALCALNALPPALLSLAIQALVHDVRRRAGATPLNLGEAMRVAMWQMAAMLIPMALAITAVLGLIWRQPGVSLLCLVAALLSRLWLLRRALAVLGVAPQAVTSGPLRDRIFELAARAGVKLKQLYVMPMARLLGANAFAVSNGTIMLTDVLLANLSEREVLAVMAHEVAHLKHKHPLRIARTGLFMLLFPLFALETFALMHLIPSMLAIVVPVLSSVLATLVVRRRFEYEADLGAIELCPDPEALITGLVRISRLNHMPLQWSRWAEHSLTHPSTRRRIVRIAERADIAPERLATLLGAPAANEPHFEFPRALDAGRLFTSSWKMRTSVNLSLLMIAVQAGVPALVVRAVRELGPPLGTHPGAILVATLAASFAMLLAVNWLSVDPARSLERPMRARLARHGVQTGEQHATFVGLSPGREPRVYEQSGDWDLGFVVLLGEQLCYFGEETSFTLDRARVQDIQLGPGIPTWIPAPRVIVSWQSASGETHQFSLRPADVRSLAGTGRASRALLAEFDEWLTGAPTAAGIAPGAAGDPPTGAVTSVSPRELAGLKTLPRAIVMVLFFSGAIGAVLGLPMSLRAPGLLDALLATALVQLIQRVPCWLPAARRPAEESSERFDHAA